MDSRLAAFQKLPGSTWVGIVQNLHVSVVNDYPIRSLPSHPIDVLAILGVLHAQGFNLPGHLTPYV